MAAPSPGRRGSEVKKYIRRIQMKKQEKPWRKDKNFIKLCDIVASNKLICLTGAGISKKLTLKNGGTAPDWRDLLIEINK